MTYRACAVAIVAVATLFGCSTMEPRDHRTLSGKPGQNKCSSSQHCEVSVAVFCVPATTTPCVITVDPVLIEISPMDQSNNKVTWRMFDDDWAFPEDPIKLDPTFDCDTHGNGKFFTCKAKVNSPKGLYKYTLTVVPRPGNSRTADPLDPWVVTN